MRPKSINKKHLKPSRNQRDKLDNFIQSTLLERKKQKVKSHYFLGS